MVTLEYFNGTEWIFVGEYVNENIAWMTLGSDNFNYRVVNEDGDILKITIAPDGDIEIGIYVGTVYSKKSISYDEAQQFIRALNLVNKTSK